MHAHASGAVLATTSVQLLTAIAIVAHSVWLTRRRNPYQYKFQNALELSLLGSVALLLVLCGVYTFATDHAPTGKALVVEIVMLALMCGAVLAALVYLGWIWRAGMVRYACG